jgi:hypothetical protein
MESPEIIEQIRKKIARPTSRLIVGGFRPPDDPLTSWFGRVQFALPNESWPMFQNKPMEALCQIVCKELPYKPPALAEVELISLFIAPDSLGGDRPPNGIGWQLRTYKSVADLVKLESPLSPAGIRPFPIRWELIMQDYPSSGDLEDIFSDLRRSLDENFDDWGQYFPAQYCSKVGGWYTPVQHEIFDHVHPRPEYVFQIDSENKAHWAWGAQGIGYFARRIIDGHEEWCFDWQTL